jgi:RimJ/RimL family protein N-acetyltransferase
MAQALGPRQEVVPWLPTPPRYQTERLLFTWPTQPQIEGYYREITGTDVFRNLIWNGPSSAEDLHDYWWERRQVFARGPMHDLSLAVIEQASGQMIGSCSLRPQPLRGGEHAVWDIGYLIAPRWQGRGHGSEMVRLLVDIAFRERGAERLYADAFVGNLASRRILEKNGFVLEGLCRSVIAKPDGRRDEWKLAMTREDWERSVKG